MSSLFALTQNQLAIWLDQSVHADCELYNIGGCLDILGDVRYDLMNRALQQLIAENDALRLHVCVIDGQPFQTIQKNLQFTLPFHDFSATIDADDVVEQWLMQQFQRPFSLEQDAVYWRMALVRIAPTRHALLTQYHHLIADGWSTKIVIDRVTDLYNALYFERVVSPAELISYADFVAREADYARSSAFDRDLAFWDETLSRLPEPLFQQKAGRVDALRMPKAKANVHRFTLSRTFYTQLHAWAALQQVTTYHLLLTGLCLYFSRTMQQSAMIVGIPGLNRRGARFKKVLGMCASMSPLVIEYDSNATLQSLVKQTSVTIQNVHKHQRYPLTAIQKRLAVLKCKRDPLFDLVFSYERQEYSQSLGDAPVQARQFFSGVARYPFAVTVCEFHDERDIEVVFEGAENYFSAVDLALLAERYQHVLQQFVTHPDCLASRIDLLPDAEKVLLFNHFNQPPIIPVFNSVLEGFNHWVQHTPDAIALSQQLRRYSYLELDRRSNALASRLLQWNIEPGDILAVCMPRSMETIVALLAIFKLRALYLPIDADLPVARIRALLDQSQATGFLILGIDDVRLASLHERTLNIDEIADIGPTVLAVQSRIQADDLAYILYTSGSTGEPKGSEISHAALSARLMWLQQTFAIQTHEKVGQSIQTHFDPCLIEIFLSLTSGSELVLAPWQRMTPESFADFVVTNHINVLALVPASLRALVQGLENVPGHDLRIACCGGEVLPSSLAKAFIRTTGARLLNVYGPTEATILASAWECQDDDESPLPIGRPIDYTQIYIVDENLQLLPLGVVGEIVIAGEGVARGYFRNPELTAKAFLLNPFPRAGQHLLYKTGDYGYISAEGYLYFSERIDRQVKISGYRIELAEIEHALMRHASVQQAAVTAIGLQHPVRTVLVAYVVSDVADRKAMPHILSSFLRTLLPDYMLPKSIIVVDALPLTNLGKIDYRRLPSPDFAASSTSRRAPTTPLEKEVLSIWRETLPQAELGVDEHFFELDSDSLTAISLLNRLEKRMGCRLSIAFLMAYPTVAMQAAYFSDVQATCHVAVSSTLTRQTCGTHLYLAASGYGDQLRFQRLAAELEGRCMLHVLYPPLEYEGGEVSIAAIAECYAQSIQQHVPGESIYLAGFSIGGVTALETARLLEARGITVKKLLLLDTIFPYWPLRSSWLFEALQWLAHCKPLQRISLNGRFLHSILGDAGIALQIQGLGSHPLKAFSGQTVLIPTAAMQYVLPWSCRGWRVLLPNLVVAPALPGLHGAMFRESRLPRLVERLCLEMAIDAG